MSDLETTVRLMSRTSGSWFPSLCPDGSELAFMSTLNGLPQVWRTDVSRGWPQLVTALEDQVLGPSWSPTGEWLAIEIAPGGGMNSQIGLIRPDGTDLRILSQGGKENNRLGGWTPDGSALMVSSNRRRPDAFEAYLVDPTSGEFRLVAEGPGMCYLTDVSPDGRFGLLLRIPYRGNGDLYLLELATGTETLLTPHEGPAMFGPPRFGPDGRRVLFTSNADTDLSVLAGVELGPDGTAGPLTVLRQRDVDELESLSVAPDRSMALLSWNHAGCSEAELVDTETLATEATIELPAEVLGPVAWSQDAGTLALSVTGSTLPADIWVFERSGRSLRQVTHASHPGVRLEQLVRPQLVTFSAHDGLSLSGFVYRAPENAGPPRCVMSFHGGPEFQERPHFDALYQALLQQGISIFAPNVRGSTGFGKRFMNLDNGRLRFDAIKDIESCVRAAEAIGIVAPGHLGVMGGSYGGYMTMAALSFYPGLFAAGADLCGIVNFATFFANTEPWMAAVSKEEYGDPDTEADLLRQLSPLQRVDQVVAPTLVLHGANDTNVPVIEAEQVVASLKARGVPCQYELFPDEGHGFSKVANRITSNVAIVRWFDRYL